MAEVCGQREIEPLTDGIQVEVATDGGIVRDAPRRAEPAISQDELDRLFI